MLDAIDRETETRLVEEIAMDRVTEHVDRLADLRRYPGSDDQWEAAEYVVETLASEGVDAQLETVTAYTSVPESATVSLTGPIQREFEAITTAFGANTPAHGVSGPVEEVELGEDSLGDLTGTIAFARGLPTPGAVGRLERAGAAAAVFGSPTPGRRHEMIVSPVWGTPGVDDRERLPDIPVAEIGHEAGEQLAERAAGVDLEATVTATVATDVRELPRPVATVEGTDSDRYFLLGNHIDSWHEGVTDNATAVAVSMELARLFANHRPRRGLVVGFWPGHSMGRYAGSARYADQNWLDLRENGVAYLHVDLNGLAGADQLWFQHMSEVADEHLDVLEGGSLPLKTGGGGDGDLIGVSDRPGRNSDQSFWGAGLSSLLSGARFSADHEDGGPVGGGWWWHTPADTRDKIDTDVLAEELRLYVAIVSRFCNSPVLPREFDATAAEIRTIVDEIAARADDEADFGPVYDRLDELDAALASFGELLESVDPDREDVPAAIETAQVQLGNHLIPALYMSAPAHEHDPALSQELLPYLRVAETLPERTGPERTFAAVTTDRGIAKLGAELEDATRVVEEVLEGR
ncbi:hypothetical protein BRC62_03865 [Halobacteriales archaeon QH_10_67_13]|nr:MAG: hypothetical protein BRC62_03865 [Halobacteriales archaeon QH_10_67_13]